ncbi:MAG: hypothetical protein AAGI11_06830 [Pseudomonadota bacterium]
MVERFHLSVPVSLGLAFTFRWFVSNAPELGPMADHWSDRLQILPLVTKEYSSRLSEAGE